MERHNKRRRSRISIACAVLLSIGWAEVTVAGGVDTIYSCPREEVMLYLPKGLLPLDHPIADYGYHWLEVKDGQLESLPSPLTNRIQPKVTPTQPLTHYKCYVTHKSLRFADSASIVVKWSTFERVNVIPKQCYKSGKELEESSFKSITTAEPLERDRLSIRFHPESVPYLSQPNPFDPGSTPVGLIVKSFQSGFTGYSIPYPVHVNKKQVTVKVSACGEEKDTTLWVTVADKKVKTAIALENTLNPTEGIPVVSAVNKGINKFGKELVEKIGKKLPCKVKFGLEHKAAGKLTLKSDCSCDSSHVVDGIAELSCASISDLKIEGSWTLPQAPMLDAFLYVGTKLDFNLITSIRNTGNRDEDQCEDPVDVCVKPGLKGVLGGGLKPKEIRFGRFSTEDLIKAKVGLEGALGISGKVCLPVPTFQPIESTAEIAADLSLKGEIKVGGWALKFDHLLWSGATKLIE